ncbi:hypothetical protein [Anaerorhabdus sp.]|uniref:hypothetical protein n=1 Tax=Anaerorhabdus sp. TaxID=1872524 RepID=UPI002FCC8D65
MSILNNLPKATASANEYIYKNGEKGKYGVLKNLPSETNTSIKYNEKNIVISTINSTGLARFCEVAFNDGRPIDFTKVSKVIMVFDVNQPNVYAEFYLAIADKIVPTTFVKTSVSVVQQGSKTNLSMLFDVSDVTGLKYLLIKNQGYSSTSTVTIKEVYLMK